MAMQQNTDIYNHSMLVLSLDYIITILTFKYAVGSGACFMISGFGVVVFLLW